MVPPKPKDTDEYIKSFPEEIQEILEQVRSTIKETAPAAVEKISYGMPSFHLNGQYLVYFAAWKNHLGLYPVSGDEKFITKLKGYKMGKGSVQFPYDKPMPFDLIVEMVKYRMGKISAEKNKKK